MTRLTEEQISVSLGRIPGWKQEDGKLCKTFSLPGFRDAVQWVVRIADLAERENHHPELLIRYRKVTITLTTHDKGGITGKDFLLAEQIEKLPIPKAH
ncbi:4a-hydroxytetrahydrobiopterin dehydratase [Gorillibacterium massiliense]|uniref:4a-hydroxytetrahydrobiopterin dehydratase n=1 Tax=Gorillibacterium massiliense TaxID=1280390 RepID=UPI0004B49CB2|nr:4a-hydroxytetrahydrobiopterin dehydratase [Gorillibacterium massiliense]